MAAPELFHRIAEPDSAAARRLVVALGLEGAIELRNVAFDSHRDALAGHGGGATPALWDGARLHVGLAAVRAALEAMLNDRA
ncbi:hypothetical protein [Anaeromyxobacter terrae]|uniref:hypothetical protein n=1 Tax=Anaeromyxobacter terrae TaxID=2925406 RepID=UPI001F56A136|nr:hypothetical protein [Anaeromyxobacter sp. SG22]